MVGQEHEEGEYERRKMRKMAASARERINVGTVMTTTLGDGTEAIFAVLLLLPPLAATGNGYSDLLLGDMLIRVLTLSSGGIAPAKPVTLYETCIHLILTATRGSQSSAGAGAGGDARVFVTSLVRVLVNFMAYSVFDDEDLLLDIRCCAIVDGRI
ncbi:hypothetical protein L1987_35947 [Smallanthus sonchifolius]|uniref:Uncharacterized protein n=1 Tax=Smallanthus sonchifolius TaxID=185202 RepID=A0ACB9HDH2_9ASTR|nr:hypothetical protein L1987_35947 [Smallanthus sonchifolius]